MYWVFLQAVQNECIFDQNGMTLQAQNDLRFADADSSNYVGFQAPATVSSSLTWTLPATDAAVSGYALVSDASGTLSWAAAGGGAVGNGTNEIFWENDQTVTGDYSITNVKMLEVLVQLLFKAELQLQLVLVKHGL